MDAEQVLVRTYEGRDHDGVAALWAAVFPNDPPWNEPSLMIRRKRAFQPGLFWVAQHRDQIIGAVIAGYDGVRGWIYHLAVHPSQRGKGAARRLVQTAEEALKSLGCPKVNLQVRADNSGVVDFYTVLGYNTEDRVSMGKPLHNHPNGMPGR